MITEETYKSFCHELTQFQRERNLTPCPYCGCDHQVRLRSYYADGKFSVMQTYLTPDVCREYMRDVRKATDALMIRFGLLP
jgi:hypothetical protein